MEAILFESRKYTLTTWTINSVTYNQVTSTWLRSTLCGGRLLRLEKTGGRAAGCALFLVGKEAGRSLAWGFGWETYKGASVAVGHAEPAQNANCLLAFYNTPW